MQLKPGEKVLALSPLKAGWVEAEFYSGAVRVTDGARIWTVAEDQIRRIDPEPVFEVGDEVFVQRGCLPYRMQVTVVAVLENDRLEVDGHDMRWVVHLDDAQVVKGEKP